MTKHFIWLENRESEWKSHCGCYLVAKEENFVDKSGVETQASFYMCPKHHAATELLEACEQVLALMVDMREGPISTCQNMLEAAIAKAEGKKP